MRLARDMKKDVALDPAPKRTPASRDVERVGTGSGTKDAQSNSPSGTKEGVFKFSAERTITDRASRADNALKGDRKRKW